MKISFEGAPLSFILDQMKDFIKDCEGGDVSIPEPQPEPKKKATKAKAKKEPEPEKEPEQEAPAEGAEDPEAAFKEAVGLMQSNYDDAKVQKLVANLLKEYGAKNFKDVDHANGPDMLAAINEILQKEAA